MSRIASVRQDHAWLRVDDVRVFLLNCMPLACPFHTASLTFSELGNSHSGRTSFHARHVTDLSYDKLWHASMICSDVSKKLSNYDLKKHMLFTTTSPSSAECVPPKHNLTPACFQGFGTAVSNARSCVASKPSLGSHFRANRLRSRLVAWQGITVEWALGRRHG